MKRTLLLILSIVATGPCMYAQASFRTIDSIDINNVNASVLVHGDMWWNADPATYRPKCTYPNGSGKTINFIGALWMAGYDGAGQLHVAAQTYRQAGNDYWPGPLDNYGTLTYATSSDWAKIWKVNRTDIQSFLSITAHTATNTPVSIYTWPAKGNAHAQGNGGAPLTITNDMAPFVDVNGNGIYEPLLGDYPDIKGDQALWWVFSDNGPTHTETHGRPLGIEVHAMSYAWRRGTLIDNVVYYEYTIVNKSANNYTNLRVGQWNDTQLGYPFDDNVGFDSVWRMGITYNSTNDDGNTAGHPPDSYGTNPPQTAITMIVLPGDAGPSYVPAGSFIDYYNDPFFWGNPVIDSHYNYYLRAQFKNGVHFKKNFSGAGPPCPPRDSGANTNYVYTGDPSDTTAWSECRCDFIYSGDRRFVLASNDFTLNAGATQKLVLAFLVADSAGGCGATSFNNIRIMADTAWGNYFKTTGVNNISPSGGVNVYPNPARDKVYIECGAAATGEETIAIYNTLGQVVAAPVKKPGRIYEADISRLPAGLYYVLFRNGVTQAARKFVKE